MYLSRLRVKRHQGLLLAVIVLTGIPSRVGAQASPPTASPNPVTDPTPLQIAVTFTSTFEEIPVGGTCSGIGDPASIAFKVTSGIGTSKVVYTGSGTISTDGVESGSYTVSCSGTYSWSLGTGNWGPVTASIVVNGSETGSCSATEGNPDDVDESSQDGEFFITTWSLPYTMSPGTLQYLSASGSDETDVTNLSDCQGDAITYPGDYHYSTVDRGVVIKGGQSAELHWTVNSYTLGYAGTACNCTGCLTGTCYKDGTESSTVTLNDPVMSPASTQGECSTN